MQRASRVLPHQPPSVAAGGAPLRRTAHTLPLLMGVDVEALEKPFAGRLMREEFSAGLHPESYGAADTNAWLTVNRVWKSGGTIWRDPETGNFATSRQGASWRELRRPRLGLYNSIIPAVDEGWTRWLLEQFEFAYTSLGNRQIQAGDV